MVILGIDPGYATVGWGVIRFERGRFLPLDFGAVLTDAETPFSKRLLEIHTQLSTILVRHRPDAVSVEKLYFQNNQKTAIAVAEARGVIPVSYTHLDVYKRQASPSPPAAPIPPR